jgi:hypothetical protein
LAEEVPALRVPVLLLADDWRVVELELVVPVEEERVEEEEEEVVAPLRLLEVVEVEPELRVVVDEPLLVWRVVVVVLSFEEVPLLRVVVPLLVLV